MKILNSILSSVTVACLLAGTQSRGQESAPSAEWSATAESLRAAQANAELARAQAEHARAEATQYYQKVMEQAEQARVQLAQVGPYSSGGAGASGGTMGGSPANSPQFTERLTRIIQQATGGGGGPGRTLVIRSGDGDPAAQASLEEDLAVMSHLLDKTIGEKVGGGGRERTAMGINVAFGPNADPIRTLYLDGYGAVFMLRVNFPLLAPPKASEASKEKSEEASEWEEAKRELEARDEGYGGVRSIPPRTLRYPAPGEAGEAYSEQKVAQLKDALLESLKNASNIRNLKADDSITVCVFGGPGGGATTFVSTGPARIARVGRAGNANPGAPVTPPAVDPTTGMPIPPPPAPLYVNRTTGMQVRGSILTIRVKKSDVDAFAKGKVDLDQFRKKAGVAIYPGVSEP